MTEQATPAPTGQDILEAARQGTLVGGPQRYRKKPVVIEAVQLSRATWDAVCEFAGVGRLADGKPEGGWIDPTKPETIHHGNTPPPDLSLDDAEIGLAIPTLEGVMIARQGDWIIRGVQGELYPCKPDIFEQTYELAGGTA